MDEAISGTVYSKGLSVKLKAQLYGVALVFLVLLYTSPAGLVFYWLLNNLFSLLKNIVFKLYEAGKGPRIALPKIAFPGVSTKSANAIFWGTALFMAAFTGAYIPSNVIVASAEEFMDLLNLQNPAVYLGHAFCLAFGAFVVWVGVYYLLTEKNGRLMFSAAMWMLAGVAVVDYMSFGRNLGLINDVLQYENTPIFSLKTKLVNLLLVFAVAAVMFLLFRKLQKPVRMATMGLLLAVTVITGINVGQITQTYRTKVDAQAEESLYAEIPLSRTGKNVMLIMLDRALSLQVPYIFQEKPELYEAFDGFTYYSNTLSFGPCTSVGISGLYGGYEYTPEAMEQRDDQYMWQKHNEALKVLPDLFYNQGYNVTICDPTYAGYSWIPDLTIYKDYPKMHTYYMDEVFYYDHSTTKVRKEEIRNRNFFYFGLTKIAPVFMQSPLYNEGLYNEIYDTEKDSATQRVTGPSTAEGLDEGFMKGYTVMEKLPEISKIEDDEQGTFLLLSSNLTHEAALLQKPDYVPCRTAMFMCRCVILPDKANCGILPPASPAPTA